VTEKNLQQYEEFEFEINSTGCDNKHILNALTGKKALVSEQSIESRLL